MNAGIRHTALMTAVVLAALLLVPHSTRSPRQELLPQTQRCCYIDLPGNAPAVGLSEALIRQFGVHSGTLPRIVIVRNDVSPLDSLLAAQADLVVMYRPDSLPPGLTEARRISEDIAWIVRGDNYAELGQLNRYLADMEASETVQRLIRQYLKGKVPDLKSISPYDGLIREVAREQGWDWRLLASVIYHESRFSLDANSHKGAVGLMQVRASRYSVDTLMDPKVNISIGARYLKRLEKMFDTFAADTTEGLKFALAAYNAGEGRIQQYVRYAASQDADTSRWDAVSAVLPTMPDFHGRQTIAYVNGVLDTYGAYTRLYSQ